MTLEQLRIIITAETSGVKKAVNKVQNQLRSLSSLVGRVTGSINNSFKKLGNNINNTFKGITKMAGVVAAVAALSKLGQAAVKAASDLQEIQNVVNVVFGESANEINAWAKSCLTNFGLVESEAKDIASTFKAMANGMGVADRSGKAMSIRLTELAADLASFRNTTVGEAKTALSGVFTGETEALKRFGVVMTEANVKAYALSQGITKSYNSMSQAEKVALRYNYVMHATADAQGDFARSAGSWANQVRVLKGQWTSFLGVLGTAVTQILAPVLQALNKILASLITITKTAFSAMGIDFSVQSAKVSSGLSDAAGSAGEITDNIGGATQAAKELYHTLAPFDELNLIGEKDKGGGSGAGAGSGDGGVGGLEIADAEVKLEKTEDVTMKSLEDMLKNLNNWFETVMGPWLQEKAKWLGDGINNIIENTPWDQLGYTAANGLNQVISALDTLVTTIRGYELGKALSEMVNSFINEFDAVEFGQTIGHTILLGLDLALGFLENFDGTKFGQKLADIFNNLDIEAIAGRIGAVLSAAISAGLDIAIAFLQGTDGADLKTAWDAFWENIDTEGLGTKFRTLFDEIKKQIEECFGQEGVAKINGFVTALEAIIATMLIIKGITIVDTATSWLQQFVVIGNGAGGVIGLLQALHDAWALFVTNMMLLFGVSDPVGTKVWDWLVNPLIQAKATLNPLFTEIGTLFKTFGTTVNTAWGSLGTTVSSAMTSLGTSISGLLAPSNTLITTMTPIQTLMANLSGAVKGFFGVLAAHPFAVIIAAIAAVVGSFTYLWNTCDTFKQFFVDIWENTLKPIFDEVGEKWTDLIDNHIKPMWENSLKPCIQAIWDFIKSVWDKIAHIIGTVIMVITPVISGVVGALGGLLSSITEIFGDIIDIISGILDFITGIFTGDWEKAWDGVVKIFKGIWDGIVDVVKAPINLVIGLINGMIGAIVSGLNAIIRKINGLSFDVPDWVPGIGGSHFGFSLKELTAPTIPLLAKGGVLDDPTLAMMGEYPGAHQNPEIVTPQNILRETMVQANGEMVTALYQMATMIINAIEANEMTVQIGDETIAKSAKKGNDAYYKRTGKPLFAGT